MVLPRRNLLRRGTEERRLEPRVMDLLVYLAGRQGEVVGREELFDEVWEGRIVGDEALTRAVSELRKALGDDARDPSYVETVPKRGYRLIAEPGEMPVAKPVASGRLWRVFPATLGLAALAVGAILLSTRGSSDESLLPATLPAEMDSRPLTSLPGVESEPALSPDGEIVAFSCRAPGSSFDLCVQTLDSDRVLTVANGSSHEVAPAWSPDGRRIAFARVGPSDCSLWIVSSAGGSERRIGSCGAPGWPSLDWAPHGRTLAVSARRDAASPYRLALLSLEDGSVRPVPSPGGEVGDDRFPAFSPRGELLAWSHHDGRESSVVVAEADSPGSSRSLARAPGKVRGMDFRPDGKEIVLASDWSGSYRLWTVPTAGGSPRRIESPRDSHLPTVARATGRLAFVSWHSEIGLWLVPSDGSPARPLFPSTRWDLEPTLSPDGRRVAFVSDRTGTREIWVGSPGEDAPMRLTGFGGPAVEDPVWSPDGRRITFVVRSGEDSGLWEVAPEGGEPRPVQRSIGSLEEPAWTPDGTLYFSSSRGGRTGVWRSAPGEPEPSLVALGGRSPRVSPDGRWVYYLEPGEPGLRRRPTEGGDEDLLMTGWSPTDRTSWAVTDDLLVVTSAGGRLDRIDLRSGASEGIRLPGSAPLCCGLAVSAAGDLVVPRVTRSEGDLMLARWNGGRETGVFRVLEWLAAVRPFAGVAGS